MHLASLEARRAVEEAAWEERRCAEEAEELEAQAALRAATEAQEEPKSTAGVAGWCLGGWSMVLGRGCGGGKEVDGGLSEEVD